MMESILLNRKGTLPCSVFADGEYGYKDMFLGLPITLGPSGVDKISVIKMTEGEKNSLDASAKSIKEQIDKIKDKI
jgi:malate dehydrogenase